MSDGGGKVLRTTSRALGVVLAVYALAVVATAARAVLDALLDEAEWNDLDDF